MHNYTQNEFLNRNSASKTDFAYVAIEKLVREE